jgi:hypothetical protein
MQHVVALHARLSWGLSSNGTASRIQAALSGRVAHGFGGVPPSRRALSWTEPAKEAVAAPSGFVMPSYGLCRLAPVNRAKTRGAPLRYAPFGVTSAARAVHQWLTGTLLQNERWHWRRK